MGERRQSPRCPVCQGPAKEVDGETRCRNSLCSFNHEFRQCPRCQSQGPEALTFQNGKYALKCRDCLNQWEEA
jgi:predicted amidophosphoribosyltransferase